MSAKAAYEFHLANWSDIRDHLPRLYEAAKGNCLEIGVRSGVSTSALLAGIEKHGGHLWSMDIDDCRVFEGHPNWTFLRADSQNVIPFPDIEIFDLAFVDGDHTHEGALNDLRNCRAWRIFVHDTDAPNFPGVRKAVEDFVEETGRKVIYHSGSFGMAEIL